MNYLDVKPDFLFLNYLRFRISADEHEKFGTKKLFLTFFPGVDCSTLLKITLYLIVNQKGDKRDSGFTQASFTQFFHHGIWLLQSVESQ